MLKKGFFFLFALISTYTWLHADTSQERTLGQWWSQEIKQEYQQGKYTALLNVTHEAYLGKYVPSPEEAFSTPESVALFKDSLKKIVATKSKSQPLLDERAHALAKIAQNYPSEFISDVINEFNQMSADYSMHHEFEELLIAAMTRQNDKDCLRPHEGWELTREFLMKYQILHIFCVARKEAAEKHFQMDLSDIKRLIIALALDHVQRIKTLELTPEHQNEVSGFLCMYIDKQIIAHDFEYLKNLGNGTLAPTNQAEKLAAEVIRSYEEKLKAL